MTTLPHRHLRTAHWRAWLLGSALIGLLGQLNACHGDQPADETPSAPPAGMDPDLPAKPTAAPATSFEADRQHRSWVNSAATGGTAPTMAADPTEPIGPVNMSEGRIDEARKLLERSIAAYHSEAKKLLEEPAQ